MEKTHQFQGSEKKVYVTSEGLEKARSELNFLKNAKRLEVIDRIQKAREFGEIENSEYDAAVEEQALIENKISELEAVLKGARVILKDANNDFVVIGSTVRVEIDREEDEFTIVGRVEANPAKKKISNESPVGSALLGAKRGEVVEVTTPIVKYKCKILEIK